MVRKQREWRQLQNEELHDLYCSPNIAWMIKCRKRWAGHVIRMETGEVCTGFWRGIMRERDPRRICIWEDNINMNLREVGCDGID
jgi:hypothetical protein